MVGVAGPWGEGKTSILNMAAERLDGRGTAQVVRFNPWLFSGSGELLQRFFSELASEVQLKGGRGSDRTAKALSTYGTAAGPLSAVPVAGRVIGLTSRAAKGGATLLRAGTTLHEQRRELHEALGELDRPIVVIVDDLDRPHEDGEIAEMVRLIRLVGDLPRVTYLVAYERQQVARALGDGDPERGGDYLEKIVQAVFEVPPARRDLFDKLLTEAMDEAVGDLATLHFSEERWAALQVAGIRSLFRNLRDVRRFASALTARWRSWVRKSNWRMSWHSRHCDSSSPRFSPHWLGRLTS